MNEQFCQKVQKSDTNKIAQLFVAKERKGLQTRIVVIDLSPIHTCICVIETYVSVQNAHLRSINSHTIKCGVTDRSIIYFTIKYVL